MGSDEPRWTGDRGRSEDEDDEHDDDGDRDDRPGGDVHATGTATLRSPLRRLGRTPVVHDFLPFASSVTRCAAPSMGAGTHFARETAPSRSLGEGRQRSPGRWLVARWPGSSRNPARWRPRLEPKAPPLQAAADYDERSERYFALGANPVEPDVRSAADDATNICAEKRCQRGRRCPRRVGARSWVGRAARAPPRSCRAAAFDACRRPSGGAARRPSCATRSTVSVIVRLGQARTDSWLHRGYIHGAPGPERPS
jgi:hypothetical protein